MHVCAECHIAAVCKEVYFGRGNCPPCASTGGSANTTTNSASKPCLAFAVGLKCRFFNTFVCSSQPCRIEWHGSPC